MTGVTFLQESESGTSPLIERAGEGPSGLAHVPANLSPQQAKVAGLLMSGTYGRRSSISSNHAVLSASLANRLRVRTDLLGSTFVQTDLEGADYTAGAVDICAAGFGAPHIRQRTYWVAYSADPRRDETRQHRSGSSPLSARSEQCGGSCSVGDTVSTGLPRRSRLAADDGQELKATERTGGAVDGALPTNGLWRDVDWLYCRDDKWRPVESATFPLAPIGTFSNRVAELRGAGNTLTLGAAQNFVEVVMEELGI